MLANVDDLRRAGGTCLELTPLAFVPFITHVESETWKW